MTTDTVPVTDPLHPEARRLSAGDRVRAEVLPLLRPALILFAFPYAQHGEEWVQVVYLYDGDPQPQPDVWRAEALIPLEEPRDRVPGWPQNGCPRTGCERFHSGIPHRHS